MCHSKRTEGNRRRRCVLGRRDPTGGSKVGCFLNSQLLLSGDKKYLPEQQFLSEASYTTFCAHFIFWPRELNVAIAKKKKPTNHQNQVRVAVKACLCPALVPAFSVLLPFPHFFCENGLWYNRRVLLVSSRRQTAFWK